MASPKESAHRGRPPVPGEVDQQGERQLLEDCRGEEAGKGGSEPITLHEPEQRTPAVGVDLPGRRR